VTAYRFIVAEKANYPIRMMCRVLKVSRSAFYAWLGKKDDPETDGELALRVHIATIHRQSRGTYGSPRVHAELKAQGFEVGRHRTARLMKDMGLSGTPKKRFRVGTTDSDHNNPIADNLLNRRFDVNDPNRVWVGDITYLPTRAGFVYLAVLIDLFSRKVVGWSVTSHMRTELCLDALRMALVTREPVPGLIHHSDRGSQYAADDYQDALEAVDAVPSMSRKGNCWDNAVAESFFGTLEQELVGQLAELWENEFEARAAIGDYIAVFYNGWRRHSTLGQVSPVAFEEAARTAPKAAA